MSKVRPLTLLLEEISNLRRENNPEAQDIFVDHNAYFFKKIINSLWIRSICENKDTLLYYIYIPDIYQEHYLIVLDYLIIG